MRGTSFIVNLPSDLRVLTQLQLDVVGVDIVFAWKKEGRNLTKEGETTPYLCFLMKASLSVLFCFFDPAVSSACFSLPYKRVGLGLVGTLASDSYHPTHD